jgi:guanylate kinase
LGIRAPPISRIVQKRHFIARKNCSFSPKMTKAGYNSAMLLLIGASASGKTEVAHHLRLRYGIVKAITHTTREPRVGEKDGVDYFFTSEKEFLSGLEAGKFVEHTYYNGHYYGCSKKEVADNKCVVVDPNGLRSFLALHDPTVVTFDLLASEKTREERMRHRGDKEEDIERRLKNDRKDFAPSAIAPTDFQIQTDGRSLDDISEEVYQKYQSTLAKRRL